MIDKLVASLPLVKTTCWEQEVIASGAMQELAMSLGSRSGRIRCEYHEGALVLRGDVASYYDKQLAQEAVRRMEGVQLIVNVLEVKTLVAEGKDGSAAENLCPDIE